MNTGWVKFHRVLLDHAIWANPNLWRVASYCLLKATHTRCDITIGFQTITLEPGQFILGRKVAAKDTNMSEQSLRTSLYHLANSHGFLTIKSTNKFSVVSICNWDTYQSGKTSTNQQTNNPVTNNQPASNQQVTTYKNVKNVKNVKNPPCEKLFDEIKLRVGDLFRRKPTTPLGEKETAQLRKIIKTRPDVKSELVEIEALYSSPYEYKRHSLITFLNNWSTELDRSRNPKNYIAPKTTGYAQPQEVAIRE